MVLRSLLENVGLIKAVFNVNKCSKRKQIFEN